MDTKVISSGVRHTALPASYVRPESDRPNLSEVQDCDDVPIIDLGREDRASTVQQIGNACQHFGFFHVINHGVSMEVMDRMLEVANEFFRLPVEEKLKLYSDDPAKTMRLSTSFNVKKETVHNWRDYQRPHCYPVDQYVPEWPSNPSSFKSMAPSFTELMKRKRAEDGDNYKVLEDIILNVDVKYADGLDPDNMGPGAERRTYQVYGWTVTGAELVTREVYGCPDPQWRRIFSMRLRRPTRYLYLEVVRTGSKSEPGTSTGHVCVGRTRVPIPTVLNTVTGGRFGLVRLRGSGLIAEGHIIVAVGITQR